MVRDCVRPKTGFSSLDVFPNLEASKRARSARLTGLAWKIWQKEIKIHPTKQNAWLNEYWRAEWHFWRSDAQECSKKYNVLLGRRCASHRRFVACCMELQQLCVSFEKQEKIQYIFILTKLSFLIALDPMEDGSSLIIHCMESQPINVYILSWNL